MARSKQPTMYVQPGTGQVAMLYFDEELAGWVVDIFRTPDGTQGRMGCWEHLAGALEALDRMQFALEVPDGPTKGRPGKQRRVG